MIKDCRLAGLSLAAFLLMLGDGMVLSWLPHKMLAMTDSNLMVASLASSYALAQVLSQIPFGLLADRIGFKPFIVIGYILSFAAALIFLFADNVKLILWGRILQGIGEAPILALAPALVSTRDLVNRGKSIGVYNASIYLGLTAGPLLGLVFFRSEGQVFMFYALTCLAGAVITHLSLENSRGQLPTGYGKITSNHISVLFKTPFIPVVLCGIALYGGTQGVFMTIIPAFLINDKSFDRSLVDIFFSLFNAAIALSQLITGPLSDKLGRKLFMIIGLLLAATGLFLSSSFDQLAQVIILAASSLGLGIFYLSSMTVTNEAVSPALKGTISGVYFLFWGLGMFWGPMIWADYVGSTGYYSGIHVLSVLLVLQAGMLLIFSPKREPGGIAV